MNVIDYLVHETERQSGTVREAIGMSRAYDYFVDIYKVHVSEYMLKRMSYLITGRDEYRQVEVTFRQMSYPPVPADSVPRAMNRLVEHMNGSDLDADYWAREFLIIHPFADGNGRVGSLLWNYLNGTLNDPEPMPYFFGENNG